jgi:hypothetical protein
LRRGASRLPATQDLTAKPFYAAARAGAAETLLESKGIMPPPFEDHCLVFAL